MTGASTISSRRKPGPRPGVKRPNVGVREAALTRVAAANRALLACRERTQAALAEWALEANAAWAQGVSLAAIGQASGIARQATVSRLEVAGARPSSAGPEPSDSTEPSGHRVGLDGPAPQTLAAPETDAL